MKTLVVAILVIMLMNFIAGAFVGHIARTTKADYRWKFAVLCLVYTTSAGIALQVFSPVIPILASVATIVAPWIAGITKSGVKPLPLGMGI